MLWSVQSFQRCAARPRPIHSDFHKDILKKYAAEFGSKRQRAARAAGLDPAVAADVIGASSGASWIFADRVQRALAGDFAPRAAAKILAKDIGIAVALARRLGVDATFAEAAQAALAEAVAGGDGDADDAVLLRRALQKLNPAKRAE